MFDAEPPAPPQFSADTEITPGYPADEVQSGNGEEATKGYSESHGIESKQYISDPPLEDDSSVGETGDVVFQSDGDAALERELSAEDRSTGEPQLPLHNFTEEDHVSGRFEYNEREQEEVRDDNHYDREQDAASPPPNADADADERAPFAISADADAGAKVDQTSADDSAGSSGSSHAPATDASSFADSLRPIGGGWKRSSRTRTPLEIDENLCASLDALQIYCPPRAGRSPGWLAEIRARVRDAFAGSQMSAEEVAERRISLLQEAADTENGFVSSLHTIETVLLTPIKEATGGPSQVLDVADAAKVFQRVDLMRVHHGEFLEALDKLVSRARAGESEAAVAEFASLVRDRIPSLAAYTDGFIAALHRLSTLRRTRSSLSQWLSRRMHECRFDVKGMDVAQLLLAPVQRLTRYETMLRDLLRVTDNRNVAHESLVSVLHHCGDALEESSKSRRQCENAARVSGIEERIAGSPVLVSPSRALIRQGSMRKKPSSGVGFTQRRWFILFTDALVYCKETGKGKSAGGVEYEFKGLVSLPTASLRLLDGANSQGLDHAFEIVSKRGTIVVLADSDRDRREWASAIGNAIHECAIDMLRSVIDEHVLEHDNSDAENGDNGEYEMMRRGTVEAHGVDNRLSSFVQQGEVRNSNSSCCTIL